MVFYSTQPVSLPVELISFTATPTENNIALAWQTASEVNNNYFTLAKSTDGINYKNMSFNGIHR